MAEANDEPVTTFMNRNRRSTTSTLYLDRDEEICEFIPRDVSDEERLKMLVDNCVKRALEEVFNKDGNVLDKSSITSSMRSVVEDLFSSGIFHKAVKPKTEKKTEPKLDDHVEKSIKHVNTYISKLQNERTNWDQQLKHYENKAIKEKKALEIASNSSDQENLIHKSEKNRHLNINFDEKLKTTRVFYEKLQSQFSEISATATALEKLEQDVNEKIANANKILNSSIDMPFSAEQQNTLLTAADTKID